MNLRQLLALNMFLQVFDGTTSYFILSRLGAELNPFISAVIEAWGLLSALVYWKAGVCALLVVLCWFGRYQPKILRFGLTSLAIVESALGYYLLAHLLYLA
jgi:hypothetical protein